MLAAAVALLAFGGTYEARAQWSTKWLAVGDFHNPYLSGGAEPENIQPLWNWPGIQPGVKHGHWKGLWISALNFTDENGESWPVKTAHIGPRILGIGEVFDIEHDLIARFAPPVVTVDGFETFNRPVFVDEVDPSIEPAQMVYTRINTVTGVTMERSPMQFSQEYHDDYHIIEYTFTNTGNTDDDEEVELPDQTLEDVYFVLMDRPTVNAASGAWDNSAGGVAWGQYTMNDMFVGPQDYGPEFRGQYAWLGYIPAKAESYNTIGNPMWFNHQWNSVADDTLGRLGGAQMAGTIVIHADGMAHAPDVEVEDDPAQPRLMTYLENDWSDITTGNDHTNLAQNEFERQWIERGSGPATRAGNIAEEGADQRTRPSHAMQVETDGDFVHDLSGDPSLGRAGGWGYVNGYGPYTMAPGEQVKIVVAEGVAGLSDRAAYQIGRTYKLSGADDDLEIPFDVDGDGAIDAATERMTKNEWVWTARDSLFQLFERAIANYESGYAIPTAPMPPAEFNVESGTNQISLEWSRYPDAPPPPGGWEVYRAQKAYHGIITALRIGDDGLAVPDSARAYELIATLDGSETAYTDSDVERGLSYFYYVQAVGEVNQDPTGMTPTGVPLRSSRYYTQTYEPAFLKRPPGASLSEVRIVPNPYNLTADPSVRFGDRDDKLAFYGLPGRAEVRIYTELGELVEVLLHEDGSGDEFWDLTTSSRQVVASGVYLAVVRDLETGEQAVQKFIIIR